MICRSDDAHKYWCPHIRVQGRSNHDSKVAVNVHALDAARADDREVREPSLRLSDYGCIGQRCSQWRWFAKSTPIYDPDVPVGYCGLAGKPDTDTYIDIYY
jgi:hypothetical protein